MTKIRRNTTWKRKSAVFDTEVRALLQQSPGGLWTVTFNSCQPTQAADKTKRKRQMERREKKQKTVVMAERRGRKKERKRMVRRK